MAAPKMSKSDQNQVIQSYGTFLQDRGILSEISLENIRGENVYSFSLGNWTNMSVRGRDNLALMIMGIWEGYNAAKKSLGFDDDGEYLTYA